MPVGHARAYRAMHHTRSIGLPELRILASVMAEGLTDESLSVIAMGIGECVSYPRKTFLAKSRRFNWTQLSKMLTGILMLDGFVPSDEKDKLMTYYIPKKKKLGWEKPPLLKDQKMRRVQK